MQKRKTLAHRVLSVVLTAALIYAISFGTITPTYAAGSTFDELLFAFQREKYANGSKYIDNATYGGYECFGFANEIASYMFGSFPTDSMSAKTVNANWSCAYGGSAVDSIAVGDVVRYKYHSIFITGIDGDTITYCQANIPYGTNKVSYGNTVSRSNLKTLVSAKLTHSGATTTGWVAHCNHSLVSGYPVVTQITASVPYAMVGESVIFYFPATYAKYYELVITNVTTDVRVQYSIMDSSQFTQSFETAGIHKIEVNVYGSEIVAFEPFYFEVHSGTKPNMYVSDGTGVLYFTPQELKVYHDAAMQEYLKESVLTIYKDGIKHYEGSMVQTGVYTSCYTPGVYEGNILLTYKSGYSIYTNTVRWYVGNKPTISAIHASQTKVKAGDTATFTLDAYNADKYYFAVGDGEKIIGETGYLTDNTFSFQFTEPGVYYVWGTAYNDYGTVTCDGIAITVSVPDATTNAAIAVTSGKGRVGNTVKLELSLENNPGFMWLQFNVAYDTNKLSLESYENKNLFPGFMAQQISDGSYNFIWEDAANAENLTGDGVLATLSFKILDGAEAGDQLPITISYDPENIYDENFENITFTPKKGTVSVISFIYGDVNDDTIINGKDVGLLKQYVAGHSVTINEDAADVFYDHTINAKDSGRLKQAVAGKDVVLGPNLNGANAQVLALKPQSAINTVGAEPTIVITGGSAKVGDTVDVEFQLANNPGFMWLQFNVAYDTDKLELTSCADSKLFPGFMKQQLNDGSYNFIWEDAANAENLTGNGVLATLTFKVLDGAADGEEIPFTITYDPENIYDENFENVTFAAENGVITVLSTACTHTSLIKTEAKAPTCTDAGNTEYWTCSDCGKIFADENASQEIELKDTVIPANGHDWKEATCTEPKTCNTCGATEGEALGHTEVIDEAVAPTCTETGLTEGKHCSVCGEVLVEQEVIPANGHDWADATCTEPKTCKTCGATEGEALGHTEVIDEAVAPTCTETGLTEGKHCSVCGEVLVEQEVIPANGHDWEDATCTEPKTCKTCGATEGDALGHTEVIDEGVAPTCTETGLTEGKHCSVCGEVLVEQEVIPANGHDWKDATCTEPKTCKTCGATEGDALGHDFGDNEEYCIRGCGVKNPDYKPVTPVEPEPVKPAKPAPSPVGPTPVTPAEPEQPEQPEQPVLPENPFTDVKEGDFFYDAVIWAVNNGITSGAGAETFAPERVCTRGEMVTFLWRAAGSPEPISKNNPFTDVAETDYCYKAVLWAVENGITRGTSATTFSPNDTCTRGQAVTFLYRYAGAPVTAGSNPFVDVQETNYYYHAVIWAVENEITRGTGENTFSPENFCTRSQIVTFLYRYSAE